VDEAQKFTAAAYDEYDNQVEDVPFTWSTDSSIGTIDQNGAFTAGQAVSAGTVTAEADGIGGSSDVHILPGDPHQITITPADVSLAVDEQQLFAAEVRDVHGNLITDPLLVWSVEGEVGSIDDSGLLTAGPATGVGSVVATCGEASATADISVSPGALHHVEVDPPSATVRVGDSVSFSAQGYDVHGNPIEGLSYEWVLTEGDGSLSTTSGLSTTFTPESGGDCRLTLTVDSMTVPIPVDAIKEETERPAEWATYLPVGLIVGLIIGILIGMLVQRRRQAPEEPPESEEETEESTEILEELEELEDIV